MTESLQGESDFPVVALGASAGGLEAFTQFLAKVPKDSPHRATDDAA